MNSFNTTPLESLTCCRRSGPGNSPPPPSHHGNITEGWNVRGERSIKDRSVKTRSRDGGVGVENKFIDLLILKKQ